MEKCGGERERYTRKKKHTHTFEITLIIISLNPSLKQKFKNRR